MVLERFGFICNPRAGQGGNTGPLSSSIAHLRAEGHQVNRYEDSADPVDSVSRALIDGCSVIVACGGDGTVGSVAGAILESGATLGVFPAGTLNHFATDLGIRNTHIAEQVLLYGHTRRIDAASVNGRLFINNSGIGIYPAMVEERETVRRMGIPKWPALVVACCKALANLPLLKLQLEVNGKQLKRATSFLFVGNNIYQLKGLSLGRRTRLDTGKLVIFTARHSGPTGLIRIGFRAVLGSVRADHDFTELVAETLTVRTRRPTRLNVSLDGELHRMNTPLEYSILPGALRILMP